jgi:uncharacterized damage-inducible protein DinB
MHLTINELFDYTSEERAKWKEWFAANGDEPLKIALSNETHPTVGALILHCFWAELWYAYWLRGEPFTRESEVVKQHMGLPNDKVGPIFDFGEFARKSMRSFTDALTEEEWDEIHKAEAGTLLFQGSARKLIAHILIHEVRHWAQAAMAVRQNNLAPPGEHDLLFSASFGPLVTKA